MILNLWGRPVSPIQHHIIHFPLSRNWDGPERLSRTENDFRLEDRTQILSSWKKTWGYLTKVENRTNQGLWSHWKLKMHFSIVPYQQYVMCSHITSVSLQSWARAADRRAVVLGMKWASFSSGAQPLVQRWPPPSLLSFSSCLYLLKEW